MTTTPEAEYDEALDQHSPDVLARLQKLLKLGQRTDSAGEAEAAMAAAQKIAVKHRIDLAKVRVLDIDPLSKEPFIERTFRYGSPLYKPMEVKYIGWILQEYFGVAIIWAERYDEERREGGQKNRRSLYMNVIGRLSDVEFASYAYEYLREVFPKLWRKAKASSYMSMDQRRSFYYGLYAGISKVMDNARKETEAVEFAALPEAERKETESNYQLAIIGEAEALDAKKKALHPVLRHIKDRPGNIYDPEARSAGFQAGLKVKIRRALEGNERSAIS